jgi:GDP-L-fucose synthase
MEVWGTGTVKREFLHVDDCAAGIIFLLKNYSGDQHINLGTGQDISIRDLAKTICNVAGFNGELIFDTSKPDGTPRKLLDTTRINNMGWQATIPLQAGLESAIQDMIHDEAFINTNKAG